jgi:hypothetical protein
MPSTGLCTQRSQRFTQSDMFEAVHGWIVGALNDVVGGSYLVNEH